MSQSLKFSGKLEFYFSNGRIKLWVSNGGLFSCGHRVDKEREGCYMKKPKEDYLSFSILNSEWI